MLQILCLLKYFDFKHRIHCICYDPLFAKRYHFKHCAWHVLIFGLIQVVYLRM